MIFKEFLVWDIWGNGLFHYIFEIKCFYICAKIALAYKFVFNFH